MSAYRDLLILPSVADYKKVYENEYCNKEIYTHDGVLVKFYPERFEHAFYKSANRKQGDKSLFSLERAQRMLWIREVLLDDSLPVYCGYDKKRKIYDFSRRVSLVTPDDYVVVIMLNNKRPYEASFVTAFLCDSPQVVSKIKNSPLGTLRNVLDKTNDLTLL